jgi:hypothetical protein
MTGAVQTISVISALESVMKTHQSVGSALIGEIGKKKTPYALPLFLYFKGFNTEFRAELTSLLSCRVEL